MIFSAGLPVFPCNRYSRGSIFIFLFICIFIFKKNSVKLKKLIQSYSMHQLKQFCCQLADMTFKTCFNKSDSHKALYSPPCGKNCAQICLNVSSLTTPLGHSCWKTKKNPVKIHLQRTTCPKRAFTQLHSCSCSILYAWFVQLKKLKYLRLEFSSSHKLGSQFKRKPTTPRTVQSPFCQTTLEVDSCLLPYKAFIE